MEMTTKLYGDAGEYYALSQFNFAGVPTAKLPDNWPGYDLMAFPDEERIKVSVKTRITTKGSFNTEHCKFNATDDFDYLVCIFKTKDLTRSWVLPATLSKKLGKTTGSKIKSYRRISYRQLVDSCEKYEGNWTLRN